MGVNLPAILNHWETVSRFGTSAKQDYPSRRRIVMVNQSAVLGGLITFAYMVLAAIDAPITYWLMLVVSPLLICGYAATVWLNRRCRYLMARVVLMMVPTTQVTLAAWLLGNAVGVQLYFFVLWTAMFLLYSKQDRWLSASAGVLWIVLFLWVQITFTSPTVAVEGPANFLNLLLIVNVSGAFGLVGVIVALFYFQINRTEALLQREYSRSEDLLKNILPVTVAERLKNGSETVADSFSNVTLLFADIVGFTRIAENLSPQEVVDLLNNVFSQFDRLVEQHGLEKIKTIGDEYMLAGGIPIARHDHAHAVAEVALQMLEVIDRLNQGLVNPLSLRVGIHSGEVVAGVIGSRKFSYDVWGDTVNTASRMQSQGLPGRIQVTETTYELLQHRYELKRRGMLRVRGKGRMPTWFLMSKKQNNSPPDLA